MKTSFLLLFQSNYRGQADFLVLAGSLAGKRVSYRYMKREFYEKDSADFGALGWRGGPNSYRRDVLASIGLVCCNSAPVPQEIVEEINRLAVEWRDHDPDISGEPARAGVYVQGHGWTCAADVAVQYGDQVKRFSSIAAAEQWLSQPTLPAPDRVWEEGRGGEIVGEFSYSIVDARVCLVESSGKTDDIDEESVVAPSR